jgi:hypothetical protein
MMLLWFVMWAVVIMAVILMVVALAMETVVPEMVLTTSKTYDAISKILMSSSLCLCAVALCMAIAGFAISVVT